MSLFYSVKASDRGRSMLYDYMEADGIAWPADQSLNMQEQYLLDMLADLMHAARSMGLTNVIEKASEYYWGDVEAEREGE